MIAALTIAFSVAVATASSALTAHPRLIATSDIINKLKDSIASGDPTIVRYEQGLIKHVDGILPLPPVVPPPPGATGILEQVREVIDRLVTLSLAYQLTANTTYSDRALKELTNITSWSTWNQVQHTLDTGKLSILRRHCRHASPSTEKPSLTTNQQFQYIMARARRRGYRRRIYGDRLAVGRDPCV